MFNWLTKLLWISDEKKITVGISIGVFFYLCYFCTNQGWILGTPRSLPFILSEETIPLIPISQWIYHLEVPFLLLVYFHMKTPLVRTKLGLSMLLLILICTVIFIFFPTVYLRDQFIPLLNPDNFHDKSLIFFWNTVDQPINCFPSLHVATCYMVSFAMMEESKIKGAAALVFATAIAISTLTTKQHYVLDVLSGLILSLGIYYGLSQRIKSPVSDI